MYHCIPLFISSRPAYVNQVIDTFDFVLAKSLPLMLLSTFRKGNLEIFIYDSLSLELIPDWHTIAPGSLPSSYLRLIENSTSKDLTFRYVIVKNGARKTAAILYFQILIFSHVNLNLETSSVVRWFSTLF